MKLHKDKMKRRFAYYAEHFGATPAIRKAARDARVKREKRKAEKKIEMAAKQRLEAKRT